MWRGDGNEILYRDDVSIGSLPVMVKGNTIHTGPPRVLFKIRMVGGITGDSMPLAVSRDGSRILFAQGVEQPDPQLTYVMTNWDANLRR